MKITKRKLIYLTEMSEAWAEPMENNCVYLELYTHYNDKKIDGALSAQKFPKALLVFQLKGMAEKIGLPFLENCIVGRWGFKKALRNYEERRKLIQRDSY